MWHEAHEFYTLEITAARFDDIGSYSATASNEHGSVTCSCMLVGYGREAPEQPFAEVVKSCIVTKRDVSFFIGVLYNDNFNCEISILTASDFSPFVSFIFIFFGEPLAHSESDKGQDT